MEFVGAFPVKSGTLAVSDPCHETGALQYDCRPGVWIAEVERVDCGTGCGVRIARLRVVAADLSIIPHEWTDEPQVVGVDSGQVGVFDGLPFANRSGDVLNDLCSALTIGANAGELPFGVASSSGLGDGFYPVRVARGAFDFVVGVEVTFIDDEAN